MPSPLCVAADVAPRSEQPSPPRRKPAGSRSRASTLRTSHASPHRRHVTDPSPATRSSPLAQSFSVDSSSPFNHPPSPTVGLRHEKSSFSLRDKAVDDFEAGLRKQGALSAEGQMSQPAYLPFEARRLPLQIPRQPLPSHSGRNGEPSALQEPYTPTTPAFYASPSSPTTPAIPFTPPQAQSSRHTPSATYTSENRMYDRARYSPSKRHPSTRRRSATSSSLASSSSRLSPVALPIGKRLPKWREPTVESSSVTSPPDSAAISQAPSAYTKPVDINRRLERAPTGPRPMTHRRPPPAAVGLGIGIPRIARKPSVPNVDSLSFAVDQQMQRRRRRIARSRPTSMLSATSSRWSDALHLEPDVFDADSQREAADSLLEDLHHDLDVSDHEDFSWEAEDCLSSSEGSEGGIEPAREPRRIAPLCIPLRNNASSPRTPDDVPPLSISCLTGALVEHDEPPALDKPFDLASAESFESTERSAFDSDTEDEEDVSPKRSRRTKAFDMVRTALRPSLSTSNFKTRLSTMSTPQLSEVLESSPESVVALRNRQLTSSSLRGNSYIMKLALNTKLSPIPATPTAETPRSQKSADAASSLPTPDTPLSPQLSPQLRHATSLPWGLERVYPSLAGFALPRRPTDALQSGPPDLPLPPTPIAHSSPYLSHRTRRSGDSAETSFVERWRRQVDHPDDSRARLEESLAKLEIYANRNGDDGNNHGSEFAEDEFFVEAGEPRSSEDSGDTGVGGHEGVLIISVEPSPQDSRPKLRLVRGESVPTITQSRVRPVRVKTDQKADAPTTQAPATSPFLLPSFDFEEPGHRILDLRGLPVRSSSRLSIADPPSQIQTLTTDSASCCTSEGISSMISQTEEPGPGLPIVHEYEPSRYDMPGTPTQEPLQGEETLTSFMHFSPRQKHQSKIRRLFNVRPSLIYGLRSRGG